MKLKLIREIVELMSTYNNFHELGETRRIQLTFR